MSKSIISIGENAFYECSGLTEIKIDPFITKIDENKLIINSSATSTDQIKFNQFNQFAKITLPTLLTLIEDDLFTESSYLIEIFIPSFVISIENNTFG